jgi:hypothetical protein
VATVRIGERDLDVKVATLGFVKHKLIPARKALQEAADESATIDAIVGLILPYVEHNEGVTAEWLLEHLPAEPHETLRECARASGQKVKEPSPGEARP